MLHRHGMWLHSERAEVRTMQGWKDEYHKTVWPDFRHKGIWSFSAAFESWFRRNHLTRVTVILEHG
jgi:hypothetical protein